MSRFIKNILWVLLLFLVVVCPGPVSAQDAAGGPGEVSLHCPLNGGRIGDPISFVLQVQLAESVVLEPSSLSRLEMRPERLQKEFFEFEFAPFDHLLLASRKNFAIKGVMRFYAPGEYRLAPLSLVCRLSDGSGNPVTSTIVSNSVVVRVASLHPDNESSRALVIPEKEPRFTPAGLDGWHTRAMLYRYAAILFLLLALFFGLISHFRRKKAPAPELKGNADRIKEIAVVLGSTLKQAEVENHWRYLVGLDHLLRNFLLAELKLPDGSAGGSGAAFAERLLPDLDSQMAARLKALWSEIDRVVALEIEGDPGFAELRHNLLGWLREYADKEGARYGF